MNEEQDITAGVRLDRVVSLRLVPAEPTPRMIDSTWNEDLDALRYESHNARNERIYKAMLAAAPEIGFVAERVSMGRGDERYFGTADGRLGVTVRHDAEHQSERLLWQIADALLQQANA